MKRYNPGNVRLKQLADAWRASGEAGRVVYARQHGFGGDWLHAQDPNIATFHAAPGEAPPPAPGECPDWLPGKWKGPYLECLQQWTHNVNLLRFFLDDTQGRARVEGVYLDSDGKKGLMVFDIGGTRAVVESAYTHFHAWDEHTQLFFEDGWLRTHSPALLQKNAPATVEIYRAGRDEQLPQLTHEFAEPKWAFREEARHFLECVATDQPFRSSASDTLHDVRLFEEIHRRFLGI